MIRKPLICLMAFMAAVVAVYAAQPSGTLPVLHIDTENNAPILTKTDYVAATYYLDPKGVEGVEAFGSEAAPLPLQIRGRGNYTWTGFDKKPYRLKLDKKQALMGMAKSKHWALLAHADDSKGFLRNAVGFQLSRLIGLPWTPGDAPVEVVLNGDYIGLYFLTETVRVDKTRVNVYDYDSAVEDAEDALAEATDADRAELQAALEAARAAEPAWLVEIDNYPDEEQVVVTETRPGLPEEDKVLRVTYDSPSDFITEEHRQWLIDEFTDLDSRIYAGDKESCTWAEKIDLTDLAKFFIVNQLVDNYESFHGSCKLYRDNAAHAAKSGTDTKWHFSPVWDFGSSFNRDMRHMIFEESEWYNHWIEEMYSFPAFKAEIDRVYAGFMDGNYSRIYEYIDNYADAITAAAASDKERWPQYGNDNLSERASDVKNKLRESVKFLNEEFNYEHVISEPVEIYLMGEINGWQANSSYKFSTTDSRIYTIYVPELSGEFKIATSDWNTIDLGGSGNSPIQLGVVTPLSDRGANCTVAGAPIAEATLTLDLPAKTLVITDPSHSGIDTTSETSLKVAVINGNLTVSSPAAGSLMVHSIDGLTVVLELYPGENTFCLPRGFYIINGNKYAI